MAGGGFMRRTHPHFGPQLSNASTSTTGRVRPGYSSDIASIDSTQLTQLTQITTIPRVGPGFFPSAEGADRFFFFDMLSTAVHWATTTLAGAVSYDLGGRYR